MSDATVGSQESSENVVVGVRLAGSADIRFFCSDDVRYGVGDWVLVDGAEPRDCGRVVVSADGRTGAVGQSVVHIVRPLTTGELKVRLAEDVGLVAPDGASPEVGSTGLTPSSCGSNASLSGGALSSEDDRFRRAKRELPVLGQLVSTRHGDGMLIAIDVVHKMVTCKTDSDGSEFVVSAAELDWILTTTS